MLKSCLRGVDENFQIKVERRRGIDISKGDDEENDKD